MRFILNSYPHPATPSFSCDIDYLKPFNGFTRGLRDRGRGGGQTYQSYHRWAEGGVIFAPFVCVTLIRSLIKYARKKRDRVEWGIGAHLHRQSHLSRVIIWIYDTRSISPPAIYKILFLIPWLSLWASLSKKE